MDAIAQREIQWAGAARRVQDASPASDLGDDARLPLEGFFRANFWTSPTGTRALLHRGSVSSD